MKILTISEMIEQLEAIKEKEGDIHVVESVSFVTEAGKTYDYCAIDDMTVKTLETNEIAYNNRSIYDSVPPKQLRCVVLL